MPTHTTADGRVLRGPANRPMTSTRRSAMQCHVQGDALECCEDHREWYP